MRKTLLRPASLLAALAGIVLLSGFGSCKKDLTPIIFVHGGSGSGAQFETQALRFASNGYPRSHLAVVEYDSGLSFPEEIEIVHAEIDARIAELKAELGVDQVDLMGHSRGTTVSHDYLSFPDRAANVAHYVNIDGRTADAPPGGVPTLALWAGAAREVQGEIVGAENVTVPDQEHIEVAVSAESFVEMYEHFRGKPPLTTDVLPELRPRISGRVTAFPQNEGLDGATLEIWWVNGGTGERIGSSPRAVYEIGPDGHWGPFKAWYGLNYEFAVSRESDDVDVRYYYEPFLRSDHLVRLNVALDLAPFIDQSEESVSVSVVRFVEFWGDRGADNDVLSFNGVDVINPVTAPSGGIGSASSAFFVFDDGSDGMTNLTSVPIPFAFIPFLTGTDLFMPSQPPGTIAVETVPRGNFAAARTVNVPSTPSTQSRLVIQLRDFE